MGYLYTYDENQLSGLVNQAKEVLMEALVAEEKIDEKCASEVIKHYAIVICRKGWFGRVFDKVRGMKEDNLSILVVKACELYPISLDVGAISEEKDEGNPVDKK